MASLNEQLGQVLIENEHSHLSLESGSVGKQGDPHTTKTPLGRLSVSGAVFNFLSVCVGAGILAVSDAVGKSGWFSVVLIALCAILANYTAKLLVKSMFIECPPYKTYEDLGEAVWGRSGKRVVAAFQCITLFGVCTIFLILLGTNMEILVGSTGAGHKWILIFGLCLVPVSWIKTMADLKFISMLGVFASTVVGLTVIVQAVHLKDDSTSGQEVVVWDQIPTTFTTAVFSFCIHSCLPGIAAEMKDPHQFPKVANIAFTSAFMIYCTVGAFAYWSWGGQVCEEDYHGNILLLLDKVARSSTDSIVVKVAHGLICLHTFLAYPMPLHPVSRLVESAFGIDGLQGRQEVTYRIVARSCLALGTIAIALVVPYFGPILNLVSSLAICSCAFLFPPLFYYILATRNGIKIPLIDKCMMLLCFVVGLVGSITGIYFAIGSLADAIQADGNPFDNFWS